MPASSPSWKSMISVLYPRRSHQRRNMRMQHLRPVLRVGAAGARVDAEDGVGVIDLAREHAAELGRAEPLLERRAAARRLRRRPTSSFSDDAELEELLRVVDVARELLDRLDLLLDAGALARSPPAPSWCRPRSRAPASPRSSRSISSLRASGRQRCPLSACGAFRSSSF